MLRSALLPPDDTKKDWKLHTPPLILFCHLAILRSQVIIEDHAVHQVKHAPTILKKGSMILSGEKCVGSYMQGFVIVSVHRRWGIYSSIQNCAPPLWQYEDLRVLMCKMLFIHSFSTTGLVPLGVAGDFFHHKFIIALIQWHHILVICSKCRRPWKCNCWETNRFPIYEM